jgi:23S rRNA (uracil1939-C5)-methyltransferase
MPAERKPKVDLPTVLEVEITDLGHRGDGIGHAEGMTVFVPYAAPGDRLKVRVEREREGGYSARIVARLADGPDRAIPPCIHFGDCGGCAVQHLNRDAYSAWKEGLLREALSRRGINVPASPMIALPPGTRRRAVFVAERRGGEVILGFNAIGSGRVVDLSTCHILLPELVGLLAPLRAALATVLRTGESADVSVTRSDSGIDLWLKNTRSLSLEGRQVLISLAERLDLARVSAGRDTEPVALRRQPRMMFTGTAVSLPVDSFLQPSTGGEAALVNLIVEALGKRKKVADLYAGCGTFTFALAPGRRVHAVEGNAASHAALAAAGRRAGGRITSERRDLAREPLGAIELNKFDAVVFDPPRAGAKEQVQQIARSKLHCAVGVSCNPASFARDARILLDAGFSLTQVTPVDQFPWSAHLELVGVFSR